MYEGGVLDWELLESDNGRRFRCRRPRIVGCNGAADTEERSFQKRVGGMADRRDTHALYSSTLNILSGSSSTVI